jgi:hypothetical protein
VRRPFPPASGPLAAWISDIQHQDRVRVDQLRLDDGPGDLDDFFDVAAGIAMVRQDRPREGQRRHGHASREK